MILVIIGFVFARLVQDVPRILDGTVPSGDSFPVRYARHWGLAYAHILPAAVYLIGAPLQLSRRFRERHLSVHRRLGRVLVSAGIIAGVFALVFGLAFPYGGALEASATALFGALFVAELALAVRAVKRGDIESHRGWMIRAFAIGLAVGTIRVWLGLFALAGLISFTGDFSQGFGWAFWLSFPLHAFAAEIYLSRHRISGHAAADPPRPAHVPA
ncbi:MAG: DUF2306 domain-containing protein [Tepidiformaceae bacterium]